MFITVILETFLSGGYLAESIKYMYIHTSMEVFTWSLSLQHPKSATTFPKCSR